MTREPVTRVRYPFGVRTTQPLQLVATVVIAVAVITGAVVDLVRPSGGPGLLPLFVASAGYAVAWRWRYIGLVILLGAPFVASLVNRSSVVTWTVVAMSVFVLTLRGARARFVAPLAAISAYTGEALVDGLGFRSPGAITALAATFAFAATGSAIREHFRFLESVEQRATEAIRLRSARAGQRVTEERLRIARDLHDIVGHQVAVVNMQIGMAEVALPGDADRSRDALLAARAGVRTILLESQRILTVLRLGGQDVADDTELHPTPTLAQVGELIASYRAIGLDVTSYVSAIPDDVDPTVQTAMYRVLQEALTNAHRHGQGTTTVNLRATAQELTLDVRNPVNPAPSAEGSGYGLLGVQERVESAGGSLQAVESDGVYTLVVTFPTR